MRRFSSPTPPMCLCGKITKMATSWTSRNPGRRYAVCADGSCDFWDWIDGEMCRRSTEVIPGLLKRINTTEQQRDEMEDVLRKLETKPTMLKMKVREIEEELQRQRQIRKWLVRLLAISWILMLLMVVWHQDERMSSGMLQIKGDL